MDRASPAWSLHSPWALIPVALMLVSQWGDSPALSPARASPCTQLERRLRKAQNDIQLRYGGDTVARSVAVAGAEERTAVLLWKLVSGQGIRVAVVGGSITAAGHLPGGVRHGTGTYGAALILWLQKVFPARHSPHRLLRAFLPGAGSFALRFCAPQLFDTLSPHAEAPGTEEHRAEGDASERAGGWKEAQKADLILLELAANDWAMLQPGMTPPPNGRGHVHAESLVRQLLALPSRPLVLLLHFGVHHHDDPRRSVFTASAEPYLDTVAAYYGIPAVSMWRAFFPLLTASVPLGSSASQQQVRAQGEILKRNLTFQRLFVDRVHPSVAGHEMAGSLVAHRLFNSFLTLLKRRMALGEEGPAGTGKDTPGPAWHIPPCPEGSLCHDCSAGQGIMGLLPTPLLWSSAWLPPPIESEAKPEPVCFLADTWGVSSIGSRVYEGSIPLEGREFHEQGAAWELVSCGPLVPQTKCWRAVRPGEPLRVRVDVFSSGQDCKRVGALGIVYKMMSSERAEYNGAGADLHMNEVPAGTLAVQVPGNTLTHWYLNASSMLALDFCQPFNLSITPQTSFFHMVAIVAD